MTLLHLTPPLFLQNVVRFSELSIKEAVGDCDLLKLKAKVARDATKAAHKQLLGLEDMEGSVTMVDFEQIKIRNQQFQEKMAVGNELMLKEKTGVMTSAVRLNE